MKLLGENKRKRRTIDKWKETEKGREIYRQRERERDITSDEKRVREIDTG